VRIIVGFAAGGGVDIMARLIGQSLSERLGQQFIIENRTCRQQHCYRDRRECGT
jgi:tripartite-type tricarboxylate transporter receptor subunit TctC